MCHLCDDKSTGLGIVEFATRNLTLATALGEQALQAIRSGDDRQANIAARQASRYAIAAEHFQEEYRRRFKEQFGHDPEQSNLESL
jgi:hypothetical protein